MLTWCLPIEGFKDFAGSQVELVQDHPVPPAHRRDKSALPEDKAPALIRHIAAQILLQVRLVVVVDAHAAVSCPLGQVCHQRSLAAGSWPLQACVIRIFNSWVPDINVILFPESV